MRVQFQMESGIAYFPGLNKPITIDSDQLAEQEADELKRLVNAAHFSRSETTPFYPQRGIHFSCTFSYSHSEEEYNITYF